MSDQEKKDKRFSIVVSAIIHSMLIALFLVLVAWREPDPPVPEYGIELNLGFQDAGSGDLEKTIDAPNEETDNELQPDADIETENNDLEETQDEVIEEQPVEETVEETVETEAEPIEEVQEETPPVESVEEEVVTEETSEVEVKKEETPPVEEKKEEETPPVEEKKVEEQKAEEKKDPVIDNRAIMGGKKTNTDNKEGTSNNQGQTEELGNEGDPEGKPNTKGIDPGGADIGGVSYSLDGWEWTSRPSEKDDSQDDGFITFTIRVNDTGKVEEAFVRPRNTNIKDNEVVEFYRKQVLNLKFRQKDSSKPTTRIIEGTVTFIIKTK